MRALFVALVAGVAALVVAAALWPRLIERDAVQAELRRRVQEATGPDLAVRGRIGVDLFPWPRLSLARVALGTPPAAGGAASPRADVDRIDLEVASLPFLGGRLEVTNVRLVRPRVTLAAASAGALVPDLLAVLARPSFQGVQSIRVVDGRADVAGLGTRTGTARLEGLDGTLRRDASSGRVGVSLAANAAGTPLSLEAELGEPSATASSLRFELAGGQPDRAARLDFRGFGTLGGAAPPALKGEFTLEASDPAVLQRLAALARDPAAPAAGRLPRTAGPLLLEGQAEVAAGSFRLAEVTCRLGVNTFTAALELAFAGDTRLDLEVDGSEFVLDADALGDLRLLAALPWWEIVPPRGKVALRLGVVRWREEAAARQLRLEAALAGPGEVRVDRLTATLPGATDLSFSGTLRREGGAPSLAGSLSLTAEDARALLGAAGLDLEGRLPARAARTLALSAALAASPARVAVRDLDLRLDGTRLTGSAAWVAGPRPRLALSGSADRIDLEDYLPSSGLPGTGQGERLRDLLTAVDATVDMSVARANLGGLRGEGLYLRALLERGLLRLDELSVRDLAESRLRLAGTADLPVASFELSGELEATRPARLLRALGLDPPATVTRFAPVRLTGTARGNRESTSLQLGLNAVGLNARLGAAIGPWFDPASSADVELTAEAARLGDALRDLGLGPAGPALDPLDRPLRLAARLRRVGDGDGGGYALSFEGDAPPSRLEGRLGLRLGEDVTAVTGTVDGTAVDRDLLAAALEVSRLAPDPAAGTWFGRLPTVPLTLERFRGLDLDLRLRAARVLGLGAGEPGREREAAARFRLDGDHLSLDDLRVPLAGGELAGVVTLDTAEDGHAIMGVDVGLEDARPERLLPLLGAGDSLAGELDLGLRLAGSGRTLPELVGSFEGEGSVQLRQGRLRGAGLLSPAAVSPTAGEEQLRLGGALAVSRGVLASPPGGLALALPGAAGTAEVRLDLLAWMAEIGLRLSAVEPSPHAAAPLPPRRFLGPPGRLRDVSAPLPERPPPEASPTGPASPPAAPTGRTPPA